MAVRRLDSRTIDRIAAGEVVERPASAVKELVENALDAGARRVRIEVTRGGAGSILVRDDGAGMSREDAALAVERHTTSKIGSERDLDGVASFGFRGEALPSIGSVSRLTITTSDGASPEATRVVVSHGGAPAVSPAAHPRGTEVRVEGLFDRTPARRKFLKSPAAEAREITRAVVRAALSRHEVGFELLFDAREALSLPASSDARGRIVELFGREVPGALVPLRASGASYAVEGFATSGVTFATRRMQHLFVNGRAVEDRGISRAISDAARESLRTDRHPGIFLYLTAAPGTVDVNVSPAKTEVRFSDSSEAYRVVFHAVRQALTEGKSERPLAPARGLAESAPAYVVRASAPSPVPARPSPRPPVPPAAPGAAALPGVAALGQYDDSFVLARGPEGLLVVDQHAAHERVLFERIRRRRDESFPPSQRLLVPAVFEVSAEEAAAVEACAGELAGAGFAVERLSGRSVSISGVPAEASGRDPAALLRAILDAAGESFGGLDRFGRIAATLACRSAITIHRRLAREEMDRLLSDWIACEDRFTCPHGRPTALSLSDAELFRFFERSAPSVR